MTTPAGEITSQQAAILRLIAIGDSNIEIGAKLHVAEDTVKTHIRRLTKQWGARNRTHCVHLAYQRGLLTPGETVIDAPPPAPKTPQVARRDPLAATFRRVGLIHQAVKPEAMR